MKAWQKREAHVLNDRADLPLGGLSTNLKTLKANLFLSATVALIGISVPIASSFILQSLLDITRLQAFAAGAALCSTSLGTTFTVLTTSGLTESRLGVVLTSAAMMDDVVGLVMVQVISTLGGDSSTNAVTVVRPILVSIAFVVILPPICLWVVRPLAVFCFRADFAKNAPGLHSMLSKPAAAFALRTAILLALVTGSRYAGTSNLFAAYLAGVCIVWWDGLWGSPNKKQHEQQCAPVIQDAPRSIDDGTPHVSLAQDVGQTAHQATSATLDVEQIDTTTLTGLAIYERYYNPAVQTVLKPFFFASIGFSIPITKMFTGGVVWRGFVYSALMAIGKFVCGLCLVRFSGGPSIMQTVRKAVPSWFMYGQRNPTKGSAQREEKNQQASDSASATQGGGAGTQSGTIAGQSGTCRSTIAAQANISRKRSRLPKPRSLYPAAILGSAMVARGEIGFLISSVAESNSVYSAGTDSGDSELFLVVTWAILICTFLGPVTVGLLVRRVRRLQKMERSRKTGREDPLSIWGVVPKP